MKKYALVLLILIQLVPGMCHSQSWQWVRSEGGRRGGGFRMNSGTAICCDNAGNIYAAGFFSGVGIFGNDSLQNYDDIGSVLIKYDTSGRIIWARHVTTGPTDYVYGICIDKDMNVCIAGSKAGNSVRNFTAKYNGNGKLMWENNATGSYCFSVARGIVTDKEGNFYVAGDCRGITSFDTFCIGETGKYTIYLAKYSKDGKVVWVNHALPSDGYPNEATCLAIDKTNHIYMGGQFFKSATFGRINVVGKGESDAFIARYSTSGKLEWVKSYGSTNKDIARSIAIDCNNNCVLAAYFTGSFTYKGKSTTGENLIKLTAAGNILWVTNISVCKEDCMIKSALTTDRKGAICITRYFGKSPLFGDTLSAATGSINAFVAKCSASGKKLWKIQAESYNLAEGSAICVDDNYNIYITGYFIRDAEFGKISIDAKNGYDGMFVGMLRQ